MAQVSDGRRMARRDDIDDGMTPATHAMCRRGLFGRRVRLLRESLGLTPAEFGTRFGFAECDLLDWERGRAMPEDKVVARIAELEAERPFTSRSGDL